MSPEPLDLAREAHEAVDRSKASRLAGLLDELAGFVRRFVVLGDAELTACALWTVHTHAFECSRRTPYLAVTSAEAESGKTRLLEVLERLVANPWLTERTSAAALIRTVDAEKPTLLLDESDTAFSSDKEYAEALRNILNAGYRSGGTAVVCVKEGGQWIPRRFSTFCPKVIAGIGALPTTVASRAVPIRLLRRAPGETVEDFFEDEAEETAGPLRERLAAFAEANAVELEAARRPALPLGLRGRAAECWRPLFAIADMAGEEWGQRARTAAVKLATGARGDDASTGIRLLADVQAVLNGRDRMPSAELVAALNDLEESPWGEWNRGRGLSPASLAAKLRGYGVRPRTIRLGDEETAKGYLRTSFEDPWARYLSPSTHEKGSQNVTTSQPASQEGLKGETTRHKEAPVTAGEEGSIPHESGDVTAVTVSTADDEQSRPTLGHDERIAIKQELDRKRREEVERLEAAKAEADRRLFEDEP